MKNEFNYIEEAINLFDYTSRFRRQFHMFPETAFNEFQTASTISDELNLLGYDVKTGVGKTGVVADLIGSRKEPVVMLRFDMDALPIIEENNVDYISKIPGVMHACGHDAHMAVGLTIAKILSNHKNELQGSIKLIFQPAEEGTSGALAMISDGALENPIPKYAIGFHVWNDKPVGWIGIVPGPSMAGVKDFEIEITGQGGHAAIPQRAIDPIVTAAQIILAIQTIISRNISPLNSGVVSVTQVEAGTALNIIPSKASLKGTIRYFETSVGDEIISRMENICMGVSNSMGCSAQFRILNFNPPVVNDDAVTSVLAFTAQEIIPDYFIDNKYQTMGAEDVAEFLNRIPGCYVLIGSSSEKKGLNFGHHHPKFDIDETVLPYAVALLSAASIKLMNQT